MRLILLALTLAVCLPHGAIAQPGIHPDELKLKPEIDKAIADGVEALIRDQLRDGTWGEWGHYKGGKTALCTYALLNCGVSPNHPAIRRAFLYLDNIEPRYTYTIACMMLAYGAAARPGYKEKLEKFARTLMSWQRGDFGYPHHPGGGTRPDLSCTQYGALGLWIAQKHKIKIPSRVWLEMIPKTLNYQERPKKMEIALPPQKPTGHTVTGGGKRGRIKVDVAGFKYVRNQKPTGSMTTAGVSILQICKIGMGGKLGSSRRKVDRAIDAGVNWLAKHFAVDKNPFKGQWHYYYLYGLERVGSLTRLEQMGKHWWYLEGARFLLEKQQKNGHWGGDEQKKEVHTSFALLFLRRSTQRGFMAAAVTGKKSGGDSDGPKHLFDAGDEKKDDVLISAAGQQPLALWIKGFGTKLKERHKAYGLRVVSVEYLEGDRVLGQLVGNPTKAWTTDAFLHRAAALKRGLHKIRARIELVSPEVATGKTEPTEKVLSPEMEVSIRDVFASWMEAAAKISHANLINQDKRKRKQLEATASSASKQAMKAVDGKEKTHWVCDASDPTPTLSIDLGRIVAAKQLILTQAGSRSEDIGKFDHIKAVEIRFNGKSPQRVELAEDQLAITTVPLGKGKKIRRIDIKILERTPGRKSGQAGFTEIALTR